MTKCYGKPQHEFIEVVKGLGVCECSATGWIANLKDAVAEARRLIELEGGYQAVRDRLKRESAARSKARDEEREHQLKSWHAAGQERGPGLDGKGLLDDRLSKKVPRRSLA